MLEKFLSLTLLKKSVCSDTMMPDLWSLNQNGDYPGIKTDRIDEG
jgi:hypothetical protein